METMIFDVQKFSVHDGPGIRTLVFFKGCPLTCVWCSNPEGQCSEPEIMSYPERCRRLDKCVSACDQGALSQRDGVLRYDRGLCNICGKCAEVCYAGAWKVVGRVMDTKEIVAEVAKDAAFYRQSGGGVTLGGGEPLLWVDVVKDLGHQCHALGIHVAVETCGHVPWDAFQAVRGVVDLFLYDVKHMDSGLHAQLCGVGNELILENLQRLLREKLDVIVRVPVVPGLNDSPENMEALSEFVASSGGTRVDLLPYHGYGVDKYKSLGRSHELRDREPPDAESLDRLRGIMTRRGLTVRIGG